MYERRAGLRLPWRSLAILLVALALPAAGSGAPLVEPGWPRQTHGVELAAGPDGGVVALGPVDVGIGIGEGVVAFNRDGSRRWENWFGSGCGNCQFWAPFRAWPDGSFRSIGSDQWGVDARGVRIPGCAGGVVRADGVCIARSAPPASGLPGAVSATAPSGEVLWTFSDPRANELRDHWFGTYPIVADADGTIYADFVDPNSGETGSSWLAMLTPGGALRAELSNAGVPLVGLQSGVLLREPGAIVARSADGAELWRREYPGQGPRWQVRALLSEDESAVYLQIPLAFPRHRVEALDARTGARLWGTTAHELHSAGQSGTVFLSDRWGLRAVAPSGATTWRFRLPLRGPLSVVELSDGRVAAAAGGLLYRLRPQTQVRRPKALRAQIRRRVISASCGAGGEDGVPCSLHPRGGAVLSLLLPHQTRVTVRTFDPHGRPVRSARRSFTLPPGRSDRVVLEGDGFTPLVPGRYRIIVRLVWRGGRSTRAFWVRAVR